jgi:CubicO group peptidase (beta-lactamase class C family)
MDHSGVGKISPENRATGYLRRQNGQMTEAEPDIASFGVPSGGLETSLADLLKLEASLRTNTLLKPRFFKLMITPVEGFTSTPGWFTRTAAGVTVVSKNGAAGGFSSFFSFVPDRGDAIIMLRNVQGKGLGIQGPSNAILDACCGIPKHGGAQAGDN